MIHSRINSRHRYGSFLRRRRIAVISALCAVFLLFSLSPLSVSAAPSTETGGDYAAQAEARKELPVQSNEWENWPAGPALGAEAAILMDADTGAILYEKNIHEKLYPASITKILTALIVMERCPLDEMVTYSYEAVNSIDWQTDSNIAIKAGEQITVEQSLYGLLVGSANEVATALAEHVSGSVEAFAELMNERARELGCVDSHFANANGIFDENHYTSAYDMAQIAKAFFSNDLLCKISGTATYTIPRSATVSQELFISSKNKLLPGKEYAYEYLVGSKTGYTSEARQTLVSCAQKDGMKLICVILKEESPAQFTDTVELFNYGFSSFRMVNVADADDRYTVGDELFFESDADLFGSFSPLLSISPSDHIVLPNTAEYEDTVSTLSYDELEEEDEAAEITFTYNGIYVGSAAVKVTGGQSDGDSGSSQRPGSADPSQHRIYINVRHVLIGVISVYLLLNFLIWLITLIRNYSFSSQRKDRRRRRRHYSKEAIDYDRYARQDSEDY
ncbi:MAG TPA: D-alanyl-D-alanine carboxypeptidase [Candidatus Eisenbergiella merdipullorum]|uniref:D-alanyl-D-alanine carboxypeptidase n=1 Tax=Candidatus Eisenbergiella merdipullorum TaxID=2838553 RepID=A0A9D2I7E0_9FIRM|nr:D-alanyl-D-alanine carboxypeptidase [Candidatus Eisenbergiella merdipullorum]